MNKTCQEIKCPDYNTDDGEPAWCNEAGCPAVVAVNKCLKVLGKENKGTPETKRRKGSDKE